MPSRYTLFILFPFLITGQPIAIDLKANPTSQSSLPEVKHDNSTLRKRHVYSHPLWWHVDGFFAADFYLGTPPQLLMAIFDTGSDSFVVSLPEADLPRSFFPLLSSTSNALGIEFQHDMLTGSVRCHVNMDHLTVGGLTLYNFAFAGVIEVISPIIGMGYQFDILFGLSYEAVSPGIVTFLDALKQAGKIEKRVFSFWVCPGTEGHLPHGQFIVGDICETCYTGEVSCEPIVPGLAWAIALERVSVNLEELFVGFTTAALDSGAEAIAGPSTIIEKLNRQLHYTYVNERGEYQVDCVLAFQSTGILELKFAGTTARIPLRELVRKPSNPNDHTCTSLLMEIDYPLRPWVLGVPFLEKFYTIFDKDNGVFRFAKPRCVVP